MGLCLSRLQVNVSLVGFTSMSHAYAAADQALRITPATPSFGNWLKPEGGT